MTMTMTVGELLEHAERLQADLDHKRRQIRDGMHNAPKARAALLVQVDALASRIEEIQLQCAGYAVRDLASPATASAA